MHRCDGTDAAHNMPKMRVISYSFLIFMAWRVAAGTNLFSTTPQPTTLNVLCQYALHVLFVSPAPASDGALDGTAASMLNPLSFLYRSNTLDRDYIAVPAGWGSRGMVAVLRDDSDAKAWRCRTPGATCAAICDCWSIHATIIRNSDAGTCLWDCHSDSG